MGKHFILFLSFLVMGAALVTFASRDYFAVETYQLSP